MTDQSTLTYTIKDPVELNLSYMPFVSEGGLFIPTETFYPLGTKLIVELFLPGQKEGLKFEGKVIWVTPPNALYQVLSGIGVQFIGTQAPAVRSQIEANLDRSMEIGGYTLGTPSENKK